MKNIFVLITLLSVSFLFNSCSGVSEYYTPVSSIRRDSKQEISDAEILKAFATKPQLVKPLTIALYGGGASIKGLADSLKKLPHVIDVFEISPGLIESDNYYQRRSNYWSDSYYGPEAINISQLRLAAAQAKCDLLIYCGAFHKYSQEPNFLAYSYILLLTGKRYI